MTRKRRFSPAAFKTTHRHGLAFLALTIALTIVALEFAPQALGCGIKGNIAEKTGERIYHLPEQKYYWSTRINLLGGERWFCSESNAQAAGWRKSRV